MKTLREKFMQNNVATAAKWEHKGTNLVATAKKWAGRERKTAESVLEHICSNGPRPLLVNGVLGAGAGHGMPDNLRGAQNGRAHVIREGCCCAMAAATMAAGFVGGKTFEFFPTTALGGDLVAVLSLFVLPGEVHAGLTRTNCAVLDKAPSTGDTSASIV